MPQIQEESFDLVVSFMGYFMPQPDLRFINEILRILSRDGLARLHLSLREGFIRSVQNIQNIELTENKLGFFVVTIRK